ncbi:hypothetical protein YC2023_023122 [Brassica napus]
MDALEHAILIIFDSMRNLSKGTLVIDMFCRVLNKSAVQHLVSALVTGYAVEVLECHKRLNSEETKQSPWIY